MYLVIFLTVHGCIANNGFHGVIPLDGRSPACVGRWIRSFTYCFRLPFVSISFFITPFHFCIVSFQVAASQDLFFLCKGFATEKHSSSAVLLFVRKMQRVSGSSLSSLQYTTFSELCRSRENT